MMNPTAPEVDPPSTPHSGAVACLSRLEDCRCRGHNSGVIDNPNLVHICSASRCGAMWIAPDDVLRLPYRATLRRRYDRADLRVA